MLDSVLNHRSVFTEVYLSKVVNEDIVLYFIMKGDLISFNMKVVSLLEDFSRISYDLFLGNVYSTN